MSYHEIQFSCEYFSCISHFLLNLILRGFKPKIDIHRGPNHMLQNMRLFEISFQIIGIRLPSSSRGLNCYARSIRGKHSGIAILGIAESCCLEIGNTITCEDATFSMFSASFPLLTAAREDAATMVGFEERTTWSCCWISSKDIDYMHWPESTQPIR